MRDLELAEKILKDQDLALVIVKRGRILFKSRSPGMGSLLQAVEEMGESLHGSSAADRIVGRAAALLLAYSHIKEVYARILSSEGLRTLRENDIGVEFESLVPRILDRDRKDTCPFEKFSLTIESPDETYERLKAFAESLKKGKI